MLSLRQLPSSAELDRRLEASRQLAARAQRHIDRAHEISEDNNLAAIITRSLGLTNGGGSH